MRSLLEPTLGYQNPIYLATRKTERRSPILSAFLAEFHRAHRGAEAPGPAAAIGRRGKRAATRP